MIFIKKNDKGIELLNENMKNIRQFDDAEMQQRDGVYNIHKKGCDFVVFCTIPTAAAAILNV